jgi:hypothetical protein
MEKLKIELVIERAGKEVWGRVNYNDNLIVDVADNLPELETRIKNLLKEFEELEPESVSFVHSYDVYALFDEFDFLNISKIATHVGINPGLLRQYASGVKHPSQQQAKKIEDTIHALAKRMQEVSIYTA